MDIAAVQKQISAIEEELLQIRGEMAKCIKELEI